MLDRIRRKLFLSLKVMTSSTSSSTTTEDNSQLKTTELMDILRKGSSALSRSDVGMDLGTFLDTPIQQILDDSREREGTRDAKLKKELVASDDTAATDLEIDEKILLDAEEEEQKLLSGVAQVQSRLFEGKFVKRNQDNRQIAQEWQELQKRAHVDRTVVVDGITVIADHMGQTAVRVIFPPLNAVLTLTSSLARGRKFGSEKEKEGKVRIRGLVHLLSRWRRCRPL
jgi:SWI/SNF-related matrix-associated actin-dependent regulator of chromatin subfamily A member 5